MTTVSEILTPAIDFLSNLKPEEQHLFLVMLETANRLHHKQSLPDMAFFQKTKTVDDYWKACTGGLFLLEETLRKYPNMSVNVVKNKLFESI
jgi:hypothetical protein